MGKTISQNGINLMKSFEGCRLTAYKDSGGVWTIGYGTTNSVSRYTGVNITAGLTITQQKAEQMLTSVVNSVFLPKVLKYDSQYNWNQNQLDALCSFAYNCGSIDDLVRNGTRSIQEIAAAWPTSHITVKSTGQRLQGLVNRRKKESDLFKTPTGTDAIVVSNGNPYAEPTKLVTSKVVAKENRLTAYSSSGNDVRWVQWELLNSKQTGKGIKALINDSGGIDGICGDATVSAIKKFQKRNSLEQDGIVGKMTRTKMKE